MRTTLRLDDHLLIEAKKIAAESGRTLTAVIEDALRESFYRRKANANRPRVELPTFGGGGVLPGVDLTSNAALLELMESERDNERRERVGLRPQKRRG